MSEDPLKRYNSLGLVFQKPDVDQVQLPSDITDLSSEQLAEKFTGLTAWANYVAAQLAVAIIAERTAERKMKTYETHQMVLKGTSGTRGERVTFVKAQIADSEQMQDLVQSYEDAYAYRKLLEMTDQNHERDIALVSREITRRGNENRATRTSRF